MTASRRERGPAPRSRPVALGHLVRAAGLHDVGKVAIPESILSKPGPLDDGEMAFVRRHTLIGERILLAAPSLAPEAVHRAVESRALGRHRLSDGLAGEQIPLSARGSSSPATPSRP